MDIEEMTRIGMEIVPCIRHLLSACDLSTLVSGLVWSSCGSLLAYDVLL